MRTVFTDVAVVIAAVGSSLLLRSSQAGWDVEVGHHRVRYWAVAAVLAFGWVVALGVGGAWDRRVVGRGTGEFRRMIRATLFFFGTVGVLAYLLRANLARGYVAVALPLGLIALLSFRAYWRRWLRGRHRAGELLTRVLVVGRAPGASALAGSLQAGAGTRFLVVGLCLPLDDERPADSPFPVVGTLTGIEEAVQRVGATAVAVSSCDLFGPAQVRSLAWGLEGTGVRIILAPSLVDVAGPRIHIRPVAGLPLMHVEEPRFSGPKLVTKTALDLAGAALGLIVLSPGMLAVALAIKFDDGGPVFFRQDRVGLGGRTFRMWKFRSMHRDAEKGLDALAEHSQGNAVLFKMKVDPRVTRIGRVLRRFSVDELPQLLNVLTRDMSLVGPRPPLAREVALYSEHVHRRFLLRPGLTGLWQVSGRSDLTWEESVRLDLYYVENWSAATDLNILLKTAGAVFRKSGAY